MPKPHILFYLPCLLLTITAHNTFSAVPAAQKLSPRVYDMADTQKPNLYFSSVFRQVNARLFREIQDSVRSLTKEYIDTAGLSMTICFRILKTGAVDSVTPKNPDSLSQYWLDKNRARVLAWKFKCHPALTLLYLQDIRLSAPKKPAAKPAHPFGKSIWMLLIGATVFGFLMFLQ